MIGAGAWRRAGNTVRNACALACGARMRLRAASRFIAFARVSPNSATTSSAVAAGVVCVVTDICIYFHFRTGLYLPGIGRY